MRVAIKTMCVLIYLLATTVGCGQKGPLYLPGDPASVQTDIPGQYQSEPSAEDTGEENDDEDDEQ